MVSKNTSSDWLPSGWKIQIKKNNGRKIKCYINSKTRQKFYSKVAVLRHIKDESVSNGEIQTFHEDANKSPGKIKMQILEANDLQWLPMGWVLERRIRKSGAKAGTEYKCYIDPSTSTTFYSKPEVLRYLKSNQCHPGSSRQKDRRGKEQSPSKVVIERTVDQDLPSGWVKESRIKVLKNKTVRRDPFYHDPDPASRLVFRSKLEALRYLETGEISRHAYRKRKGSIIGEDVAIEKTPTTSSGKREEIPKSTTRKLLYAGESNIGQSILVLPEAGNYNKAGSKKSERSSSRVRLASSGASAPKQRILSPNSVNNSQDVVVAKPFLEKVCGTKKTVVKKHAAPEVLDAVANLATSNKSKPSTRSRGILSVDNPVDGTVQGCSNGKAQASKRKTKDGILSSVPSRSSKRLAGVDAQITFHPIAIEHAQWATNRKSSCAKPIPSLELVPTLESGSKDGKVPSAPPRSSKRLSGVDAQITFHPIPIEHSLRAANKKSSRIQPIPGFESVPSKIQENHESVNTQDWNGLSLQAPSRKTSRVKAVPCLASAPNELQDVDMQDVLVSQKEKHCTPVVNRHLVPLSQEKSSNKINDLTSQVEKCHTLDFDTDIVDRSQGEPSNKCDDFISEDEKHCVLEVNTASVLATQEEPLNKLGDLTFPHNKHCTLHVDREAVLATQGEPVSVLATQEPSNKLSDLTSPEDKHCTPYIDEEAVLATQGEPSNKLNELTKTSLLVDLNLLQLEQAPPGFSEDAEVNVSSTTLKQSLEHPMDIVWGSKVENSSRAQPIIEEQHGSIQRQTEQTPSEICFSSPLWSDPCLEFAYKTLTGSIPFDDNLAIQDYIQHQLRTSEESSNNQSPPDIRASSILRNDEAKMVSQLPEEVKLSNSTGSGSQEIKQVKNQ